MTARYRLSGYVHILRKHVVVLVGSMLLVGAAGAVYLVRQEPVYQADALLRIEQPVPNLLAGGGTRNWWAVSQAALNTELYLLREETATADQALAALREGGLDTQAAGYSPESLTSAVSVEAVAATEGLFRFSLTGPDAATLPAVVNAYAEAYAASTEKTRSRTFSLQRKALERDLADANDALGEARERLREYPGEHEGIDVVAGDNPAARRRDVLSAQLPELRRLAREGMLARERIEEALAESDVSIDDTGDKVRLVAVGGEAADELAERLATSPFVAGLPAVRANPEVQRLRAAEDAAGARDAELLRQGLLEEHVDRVAARQAIDEARRLRVRVVETTLLAELREIAARADAVRDLEQQFAEVSTEAERVARVLAGYRDLELLVEDRERDVDDAKAALERLKGMFLRDAPESASGSASSTGDVQGVRVALRRPATTAHQIAPRTSLVVALTILAALSTGLGLAFVFEYLDDTIRSKEDFDRYVGLPLLGFVPKISTRDHDNPDLASEARPGSAVAEAFRALRTSILFSRRERQVRTLLVTSAGPGEGKTTVATNLAATFARHRGPVLLVDADLRKPRVARALGLEDGDGLTNVLVGDAALGDVVRETGVEGLHVVTSGPVPPNPAELLHGEAMESFLREATERYERVVLDTPPLVAVTDAHVLAGLVDGFYLVISMGRTSRRLILRAVESLTSIGVTPDAAILNNATSSRNRYGEYYRYYGRESADAR